MPVSLEQITNGSYINYLKVLSAKAGELVYDIQIYIESDMVNSKGGVKDKSMVFFESHRRKDYSRPCHWNREYGKYLSLILLIRQILVLWEKRLNYLHL